MANTNTKTRESVKKMADSMRTVFFLSLLTNLYDVYRFVITHGEVHQAISIALGIVGTILVLQFSRDLRAEKKQALYYWLAIILVAYIRWIFVEATFSLNIVSVILLLLALAFTQRIIAWTRIGVLI